MRARILILLMAGGLLLVMGRRMIVLIEADPQVGQSGFWQRLAGGEEKAVTASKKSQSARDAVSRAEREALVARLWERVLEQHPELVLERVSLTSEEDAFSRYNALLAAVAEERWNRLATGLRKIERAEFDQGAAAEFLAEYADLLLAVRALAELPGATLEDLPMGFLAATPAMDLQSLLLLECRGHLAAGDREAALESAQVAAQWEAKFAGPESNLILETVNILQHLGKNNYLIEEVLPRLAFEDFGPWIGLLQPGDFSPQRLATVLRGEAFVLQRDFLAAAVIDLSEPACEEFILAMGDSYAELVGLLEGASARDFAREGSMEVSARNFKHKDAEELFKTFSLGVSAWYRGYARVSVASHQILAVAEVMQREAAGEVLSGQIQTRTVNVVTGQSFLFLGDRREVAVDGEFLQLINANEQDMYSPVKVPVLLGEGSLAR